MNDKFKVLLVLNQAQDALKETIRRVDSIEDLAIKLNSVSYHELCLRLDDAKNAITDALIDIGK